MATLTVHRCACGKRMSRYADRCQSCHAAKMAESIATARRVVATGKCPDCGSPLRRNSALAGWWQCAGYGQPEYRRAEDRAVPHCLFQTFTE